MLPGCVLLKQVEPIHLPRANPRKQHQSRYQTSRVFHLEDGTEFRVFHSVSTRLNYHDSAGPERVDKAAGLQ